MGLLLLIPLGMIRGLLGERMARKAEAVTEIGQQWGAAQQIIGPLLRVPVTRETQVEEQVTVDGYVNTRRRTVTQSDHLILLPETFELEATMDPELRYRGIFRSPVYSSAVSAIGTWSPRAPEAYGFSNTKLDWSKAAIVFSVSDAKGLTEIVASGGDELGAPRPLFIRGMGEWVEIDFPVAQEGDGVEASLSFALRGSAELGFLPIGREGKARIASSWPDPSFMGERLPSSREISDTGFVANWSFGEFGRNFPQWWLENDGALGLSSLQLSTSGVGLVDPIDGYRMTERSLKYGGLFIGLGFVAFFLFEALCGLRLHAMHYLLAGAAQALFFMLVLALSELMGFAWAYAIAAGAATALIGCYAASVLKGRRRAAVIAGSLAALYGTLLVILRQQDAALLAGSGLLFVALAVFMFLTRELDWSRGTKMGD